MSASTVSDPTIPLRPDAEWWTDAAQIPNVVLDVTEDDTYGTGKDQPKCDVDDTHYADGIWHIANPGGKLPTGLVALCQLHEDWIEDGDVMLLDYSLSFEPDDDDQILVDVLLEFAQVAAERAELLVRVEGLEDLVRKLAKLLPGPRGAEVMWRGEEQHLVELLREVTGGDGG